MAFRAWVSSTTGEMLCESAWVFPEGIEVGHPVKFHKLEEEDTGSDGPLQMGNTHVFTELARGVVASVAKDEVTFTWERAVEDDTMGRWSINHAAPANPLVMANAKEVSEYTIDAPQAAWSLLQPKKPFIVTLIGNEPAADGRRLLLLSTMSGEEIQLDLEETFPLAGLARLVHATRVLPGEAVVKILASDGSQLSIERKKTLLSIASDGSQL